MTETPVAVATSSALKLRRVGAWHGIRVLAWEGGVLYGCRGYELVRLQAGEGVGWKSVERKSVVGKSGEWKSVARFRPAWWRNLTSSTALGYRLMRDSFHALAILGGPLGSSLDDPVSGQTMVGAVPGALVTRNPESDEFRVTHRVERGTRPLHITAVPSGRIYWGEYFDNRERAEVHIYASTDRGRTWQIAYTFPAGSIRHVHNIVYDRWGDCLWILTGDEGAECKVLRADCDLRSVDAALAGNQQARAVAAIPTQHGLYLSTDTPSEKNHVYCLDQAGNVEQVGDLTSSSIFGCKVGCGVDETMFFSTMVEPSAVNTSREVQIVGLRTTGLRAGSGGGANLQVLARWKKDNFSMRYFQYGNAVLPDGENSTRYLAATTIAVEADDLVTTLWEVESA
jgi:hypothetical protein